MFRKTYAKINHDIIERNIHEITTKYPDYKYYIGVVKNNAYHHGIKIVNALKKGGINYFAVSSLEEALEIRKYNTDIPILILEPIDPEYLYDCITNNIAITVESLDYIEKIQNLDNKYELKIHLKLDTGMNRLGFKENDDLKKAISIIQNNKKLFLEGLYSHFATSGIVDQEWDKQEQKFRELIKNIDLSVIPIIHFGRSLTLVNHSKLEYCNGIRLGIIMYGFSQSRTTSASLRGKISALKRKWLQKKYKISPTTIENTLNLQTAFSLYSTVISVRKIIKGESVGYNANFVSKEDAYIATIPIGYADGVTKKFENVVINDSKYKIIADTMDMILVLVDNKVKEGMQVEIFGNKIKISEVTKRLNMNAYHLFNQIQNRVPRIHINGDETEETNY